MAVQLYQLYILGTGLSRFLNKGVQPLFVV